MQSLSGPCKYYYLVQLSRGRLQPVHPLTPHTWNAWLAKHETVAAGDKITTHSE